MVGIARSTLYDELKRGTVIQMDTNLSPYMRYFGDAEEHMYEAAHRKNSCPPMNLELAYEFVAYAEQQILEEKLASETICGAVRRTGKLKVIVYAKTLYNYIDQRLLKLKRKPAVCHDHRNKKLFGMSIEARRDEINSRTEFGHWEIDTVVGKKESSPVLPALDERLTRKRHLIKIPSRSSDVVRLGLEKIAELYGESFENVFKSVTSDNGNKSPPIFFLRKRYKRKTKLSCTPFFSKGKVI